MCKSVRLVLIIAGSGMSVTGYTQIAEQYVPIVDQVWQQSTDEVTQIGNTVKSQLRGYDLGPPFPGMMATVRWQLVGGDPSTDNFVDQEFDPASGFATFRIEHGSTRMDGTACLLANGQEICGIDVDNGRLVYRARILIKRTATSATGDQIPLPASLRLSITTSVHDRATGETRSGGADVIPIAVLDSNDIVTQ